MAQRREDLHPAGRQPMTTRSQASSQAPQGVARQTPQKSLLRSQVSRAPQGVAGRLSEAPQKSMGGQPKCTDWYVQDQLAQPIEPLAGGRSEFSTRATNPTTEPYSLLASRSRVTIDPTRKTHTQCVLCKETYEEGAKNVQAKCGHMSHYACLARAFSRLPKGDPQRCPVCGRRAHKNTRFRWESNAAKMAFPTGAPTTQYAHPMPKLGRPGANATLQEEEVQPVPRPDEREQEATPVIDTPEVYPHLPTALKEERPAILVGPGTWTSAGGRQTMTATDSDAVGDGQDVTQQRIQQSPHFQGIGSGYQACKREITIPIFIPSVSDTDNHAHSELSMFYKPVIDDPAENDASTDGAQFEWPGVFAGHSRRHCFGSVGQSSL